MEGDSRCVRREGNLVFAVRPKQGVAYLRRCFSGHYWISKRRGTWDIRYHLFESIFICDWLLGWERARRPTNKRGITNLLRTKAYFIVGIMDKYIDRCYIFVHVILIRIYSNTPPK